jgi:hypothetical protein
MGVIILSENDVGVAIRHLLRNEVGLWFIIIILWNGVHLFLWDMN